MNTIDLVQDAIVSDAMPRAVGEWIVVPTQLQYPSNRMVSIYLLGGSESVRAFDAGGAFDELDGGGEYDFDAFKVLERFLRKGTGITVDSRGWLCSQPVAYRDLSGLVSHIAKVSVEASVFLRGRRKKKKLVDLREAVNHILVQRFDDHVHRSGLLIGASNKSHKFDFIVDAPDMRRLAIDAALPDASSINSIVVRQLDVANAKPEGVAQMIVYDDRDAWKSEDISLLRTGGRPFAFSQLPDALARLVA